METQQTSPLSQLLNTLGITKEDLNRRSDQMRQFLTTDSAIASRVASQPPSSASQARSLSRSSSCSASFTRQMSRGSSTSARDASPTPATVKPEPEEESLPSRPFDNMEMVLERQRLNRKQKRFKKREQEHPTEMSSGPSSSDIGQPWPVNPRDVLDEHPATSPTRSKYYREHTSHIAPNGATQTESSPPAPSPNRAPVTTYPYPYYYYTADASQSQFLSLPFRSVQGSSHKTPVKMSRSQPSRRSSPSPTMSPLPPSSPPYLSSPVSSPAHRIVNVVSSPAPVDDAVGTDSKQQPPYRLPPGPYSDQRPHHSYAAIIGQAVLSSKGHRLTLQEIYEWISTVYPHFKRGEKTWMNSIRHVLSTTVHFRKVTRERSAGRSYWAIFDEDLHCFADGGYRKPGSLAKRGVGVVRPKPKKRSAEEVEEEEPSPNALAKKSPKRLKKTAPPLLPIAPFPSSVPSTSPQQPPGLLPDLVHPQGKAQTITRPTTHHQTYYESCLPAAPSLAPSDIIFPRLPNSSYRLIASDLSSSAAKVNDESVESEEEVGGEEPSSPEMAAVPACTSSSSPTSVPALTPNGSSSSPIPWSEMEKESEQRRAQYMSKQKLLEDLAHFDVSVTVSNIDDTNHVGEQDEEEPSIGNEGSFLRPVQYWGESSPSTRGKTLQPGIDLQEYAALDDEEEEEEEEEVPLMLVARASKSEKQKVSKVEIKARTLVKMPPSPSLHRRKTAVAVSSGNKSGGRKKAKAHFDLATAPSTPPRSKNPRKFYFSPTHTPLSRKGLNMSRPQEEDEDDEPYDLMRTPSRKRDATSASALPVTPKRLLFPSDSSSPFRTPGGNALSASPFRTPGSVRGGIFDPHDPTTLLDEELSSLGATGTDSPAGLYAKGSLYHSPNPLEGSPSKWARWW